MLVGLGAFAVAMAPGAAEAQAPDPDDPVYSKKDQRYKHKEGEYGGVTPGVIYPYDDKDYDKRFKRPTNRGKRKRRVTWVGFQPRDDGSARLFVQLTSEADYSQQVAGRSLRVYVHKGRMTSRNAGRRMDARHFDTAVLEVEARQVSGRRARRNRPARPRGVEITVTFKNSADAREAQASLTKEKDDYYYLFLDFAPGSPGGDVDDDDDGDDGG